MIRLKLTYQFPPQVFLKSYCYHSRSSPISRQFAIAALVVIQFPQFMVFEPFQWYGSFQVSRLLRWNLISNQEIYSSLGHTCIIIFKYSDNMELRKIVEKQFLFQTITNGAFSVDTFFFLSGFLVSYIYFRTNAKGKLEKLSKGVNEFTAGAFHFFGLLGYRFIRLKLCLPLS